MRIAKRLGFLVIYFVLTSALVWAFRHSPCGPIIFGLFTSWVLFLMSGFEAGLGFLMGIYFLYLLALLPLNSILNRRNEWKHPYSTLAIYGIGSILGFLDKNSELSQSFIYNMLGLIIGIPVVILYLEMDWRLAGNKHNNASLLQI
jgi:hypothetical protein